MTADNNPLELSAISVTQMAQAIGLSRARLYQLIQAEKLPSPVYDIRSRRPHYPSHLQEICLAIKRTGIASDGSPLVFYRRRHKPIVQPQAASVTQKVESPTSDTLKYADLVEALREMGIETDENAVQAAITTLAPPDDIDEGTLLRDLFRHLRKKRP